MAVLYRLSQNKMEDSSALLGAVGATAAGVQI